MPLKAPVRRPGPTRNWPAPMSVSPRAAAPSASVSSTSITPCGTRSTKRSADRRSLTCEPTKALGSRSAPPTAPSPGPRSRRPCGPRALSRRGLAVEYREPDRRHRRVGPVDPVATVRGDIEPVAGTENAGVGLVLEPQPCGAGEDQYPFAIRLVIPEPGGARLTP